MGCPRKFVFRLVISATTILHGMASRPASQARPEVACFLDKTSEVHRLQQTGRDRIEVPASGQTPHGTDTAPVGHLIGDQAGEPQGSVQDPALHRSPGHPANVRDQGVDRLAVRAGPVEAVWDQDQPPVQWRAIHRDFAPVLVLVGEPDVPTRLRGGDSDSRSANSTAHSSKRSGR